MTFVDSRHLLMTRLFYSRLSTFLLSTLDSFTLDSRQILWTLDIYSRPSTFRYTHWKLLPCKINFQWPNLIGVSQFVRDAIKESDSIREKLKQNPKMPQTKSEKNLNKIRSDPT